MSFDPTRTSESDRLESNMLIGAGLIVVAWLLFLGGCSATESTQAAAMTQRSPEPLAHVTAVDEDAQRPQGIEAPRREATAAPAPMMQAETIQNWILLNMLVRQQAAHTASADALEVPASSMQEPAVLTLVRLNSRSAVDAEFARRDLEDLRARNRRDIEKLRKEVRRHSTGSRHRK